jgi:PAS domain S-box-containing protein
MELTQPLELRRKAEELEKIVTQGSKSLSTLSPEEIQTTLHELRVHQIELEMQNEELRLIQEELDISRERYFDLYDLAPIGYCTLNESGMILEANLTISTQLGVNRQYLVKKPLSQFVLEEDQPLYYQFRKQLRETKNSQELEIRILKSDKTTFWAQLSAIISKESENSPTYRIVLLDISERKRAQFAIKSLNDELENRVKVRTTDLENSNNAMKSFSYTVSHDLRAPLRAIDGFSAILASKFEDQLGSEGTRLLEVIRDNAKRMNQLIIDLLDLAKATNFELKKCIIDMNQLVNAIYQESVAETDRAGIAFIVHPLLNCFGDPHLLSQVWTNLIGNAVKFSRKKGNTTIQIQSYEEADQVVYSIKDNGVGFNPAYQKKLFEAFQRLHSDEEYEGTGIGLVLVDRIILRHGGKVWAKGIDGEGATFYFSLPIKS